MNTMRHQAEAHDHARAGERGERIKFIADDVISKLLAAGVLRGDPRVAKVIVFHVVSDHLFGNRAIDIPEFD
jgi:hypothetical protein